MTFDRECGQTLEKKTANPAFFSRVCPQFLSNLYAHRKIENPHQDLNFFAFFLGHVEKLVGVAKNTFLGVDF